MKELTTCYLCGKALHAPTNKDHVPMRQLWTPELRAIYKPLVLLTIPVHKACNSAFQMDEDYFLATLMPFFAGSIAGDSHFRKHRADVHEQKNVPLKHMVLKEFDTTPSGLILPVGKVAKRFDGVRLSRVAWKIVRGLYFHHFSKLLPADWTIGVELFPASDQSLPSHFVEFMNLPDNPAHGRYQGVFSYRFQKFAIGLESPLHYWALLIVDRVVIVVTFHDISCGCVHCKERR